MSNNTILPVPSGATNGDTVRSLDRAGIKTQVVQLDIGGAAAESLVTGTMPVSGSITVANASLAVTGAFYQATQPVSLASTTITGTVTTTVSGSVAVTGTFWQATQPISAASLPLPAGAATETTLAAISTKTPALGQAAMAASQPVTIASNQTAISDITATGTIAALNANVALALNGQSGSRVQITGTWVGTLQFEGTVDGTNWQSINAVQAGLTTIPQTTTTNGVFSPTPAGFAQFRVTATAWTSGTATVNIRASVGGGGTYLNQNLPAFAVIPAFKVDQTTPGTTNLVSIGTSGTVAINAAIPTGANVIGALTANQSINNNQIGGVAVAVGTGISSTGTQRVTLATDIALPPAAAASATYSASVVGLATALTATDIFTITGSATKTIRVSRIVVNGVQTTAAQVNVLVIKRSTANSAGTSTASTAVPYDSANAAATATVLSYTANPTLGTAVGTVSARRAFIPGAATASDAQGLEIISGDVGQQMMTLRGIAQVIAVNLNATTVAGSAFNITVEWTES